MFFDTDMHSKSQRKGTKVVLLLLSLFLIVLIGSGIGVLLYISKALQPVEPSSDPVVIQVEPGMNSGEIAQLLEDNGLIRSAKIFRLYLSFQDKGNRMQAGKYEMYPGQSLDDIIVQLESGDVIPIEMIRITIPEGFTVKQIAERIGSMDAWDEQTVLQLVSQKDLFDFDILDHIPDDPSLLYALEGYLFPETYDFAPGTTEEEVVRALLEMTANKLKLLPEGWEKRLQELNINFHEMMTIASMIEREVVVDHERPIVAGIIYNRLNAQMRLQIDATVQYALGEQKEVVYTEDLKVNSPYNTYEHDGLPPGPIASPSLKSIEAALYPEQTEYYYYVTKKDGSREHYFAKTYAEHLQNKERSEKQ